MPKYYVAPSLGVWLDQVNKRFPKRSKTADGAVGDTAHQARKSAPD